MAPLPHESELGPMPPTKGEARARWLQQVIDFYQARGLPFPTIVIEGLAGQHTRTGSIRCHPSHPISLTPGWIKGHLLDTEAPSYINAMLVQSRGALSTVPCDLCVRLGSNPFVDCVRSPGDFRGACGNCKWRAKTVQCSVQDGAQPPPPPLSTDQPWNEIPRVTPSNVPSAVTPTGAPAVTPAVTSARAPAGASAPTIDLTEDASEDVIDLT